ncbi:MAG: YhjD/YihY/BrkB family envelope integrity protein [Campylobacterota bacterium]|nr:YhjD/YihY/BrkB family envelope integrity protein [Campylobacterota bacterium]
MKNKFLKIYDFFADDTLYYAASLSFFTIFSILPLLALIIVLVSYVAESSNYLDLMMDYILKFINPTHSSTLTQFLNDFLANTDKLGAIGIFYLLFVFTMFFKDYEYIINKIYNVEPRAVYKLFFRYLGILILIPLLFSIFSFVSALTDISFIGTTLMYLFIWLLFIGLFILSVNRKVYFKASAISSLITLLLLNITKNLFVHYVALNTTYATIYGSFSIVLFFFLWIYISWSIYLYGIKLCSIINKQCISNDFKHKE